jgi:hypothetical protein
MDPYQFVSYIDNKYGYNQKNTYTNDEHDHTCTTRYLVEDDADDGSSNDRPVFSRLSLDIDICTSEKEKDPLEKQAVQLVLYKQNKHRIVSHAGSQRTIHVEYLSYYMENTDKTSVFSFPSFMYDEKHSYNDEDNESMDVFKEECIQKIIRLFAMEQKPSRPKRRGPVQFGYKGILYHDNVVFAFFDMKQIEKYFKRTHRKENSEMSHPHAWAVVDEILNKGDIFSIKIDERIRSLFTEHPVVWDITHDGERVTYPIVMYPVIENETNSEHYDYENATYPSKKRAVKKDLDSMELLPYEYSDIFGERYLFTFRPIPSKHVPHLENGLPAYKRVVCFMYNPQFIFSEKIEGHKQWIHKYPENFVENIDIHDEDLIMSYHKIPCICFTQKLLHHHATHFCGCIYYDLFEEIDPQSG